MNPYIKDTFRGITRFISEKHSRRLLYLFLVGILALVEFISLGLVRRTFVFYTNEDEQPVVEERMLPRAPNRETDVTRYVEETLLGPVSPDIAPLFPRGTRLLSLMLRDRVVYLDLSESAALTSLEEGDLKRSLSTLDRGIRRNFSFIKEVHLFIAGNQTR
jgi:hypothetical protein